MRFQDHSNQGLLVPVTRRARVQCIEVRARPIREAATNRPTDNGRRGMNRPKYIIHAHSITEASPTPSLTFSGASLRLFVMRKTNGTVVRMHCETNYRVKFMDPPASSCTVPVPAGAGAVQFLHNF